MENAAFSTGKHHARIACKDISCVSSSDESGDPTAGSAMNKDVTCSSEPLESNKVVGPFVSDY